MTLNLARVKSLKTTEWWDVKVGTCELDQDCPVPPMLRFVCPHTGDVFSVRIEDVRAYCEVAPDNQKSSSE